MVAKRLAFWHVCGQIKRVQRTGAATCLWSSARCICTERGFRIKSSVPTIRIPDDPEKMKHIPIVVRYITWVRSPELFVYINSLLLPYRLLFGNETEANINIHQCCWNATDNSIEISAGRWGRQDGVGLPQNISRTYTYVYICAFINISCGRCGSLVSSGLRRPSVRPPSFLELIAIANCKSMAAICVCKSIAGKT